MTSSADLYSTHEISRHLAAGVYLEADRAKLGQVVSNLVSNAANYSPGDSGIEISCFTAGDVVRVAVSDQGIGIKQADLERLFERFYRVEDNSNVSGFGIGLYLSAEIIERHGGKIWTESEVGKGSTFISSCRLLDRMRFRALDLFAVGKSGARANEDR